MKNYGERITALESEFNNFREGLVSTNTGANTD